MSNTTTIVVTVLLTRDNGHDITDEALKRAALSDDIAGLSLEHDDIVVHDISAGEVTRATDAYLAAVYRLEVEADCPRHSAMTPAELLALVDEEVYFHPEQGWNMVRSICRLAK